MVGKKVQDGDVLTITAGAALTGGTAIAFGTRGGVVLASAAIGELASLQVEGVFEFTATTGEVIAFGAAMYYIVATKLVTTTAGSNIPLGRATTEKAAGVAGVVNVKLESL